MKWPKFASGHSLLFASGMATAKMGADFPPWWIVAAFVAIAAALWLLGEIHSDKDDAPVTVADLRDMLAARDLELQSTRDAAGKLPMEPLGTDGTTYADLPDGTNLVKLADGSFRLALPVRVAGKGSAEFTAQPATLTVIKPEDQS